MLKRNLNTKALLLLSGLVLSLIAPFYLVNVMAQDPQPSQGVDLTLVLTDQQLPGFNDTLKAAFLASDLGSGVNDVTLISSGGNADNQLTYLQTLMQGGTATAHVIGMDVVWTAQFASNNWIISLEPYLTAGEMDDYAAGMVTAGTYNGVLYAYPYFLNLGILFYRTDLMDLEYGAGNWDPSDFATWEGLNTTANDILNNASITATRPDLVGYVGQFDAYEGGVVNFFEWAGSNGALDLVTSDNQVNIDTTQVYDAMTFLKDLIPPQYTGVQGTPYIIPRTGLVMDEGSSVGTWTANNSIFMRQWTFGYGSSLDNGIEFGVAPLPHFAGASGYKTSAVGGAILAVPTATTGTAREAAVNLTKFLGDPMAQEYELIADTSGDPGVQPMSNFPALKSIYTTPPTGFEWIQDWTTQLDLTLSRPVNPDYPLISNVISGYFSNLLSGQKAVDVALQGMQQDVEDIVAPAPAEPAIPGYSIALIVLGAAMVTGLLFVIIKRKSIK